LGRSVGSVRAGASVPDGYLAKMVEPSAGAARTLRVEDLNVVTDRLTDRFDLVIATNVLVYFGSLELSLALSNIAAMLHPDGVFLHNEVRPGLLEDAALAGLRADQSRQVMIATVSGAPPLADTVSLFRLAAVR